jgi:hypothetical protein
LGGTGGIAARWVRLILRTGVSHNLARRRWRPAQRRIGNQQGVGIEGIKMNIGSIASMKSLAGEATETFSTSQAEAAKGDRNTKTES